MKKYLVSLLCLGAVAAARADTVDLDFLLGILTDQNAVPIADGSLVQVIGSHDGTFGTPSSLDFLGGDSSDYVLYSGGFDSSTTGIAGAAELFLGGVPIGTDPSGVEAGDALLVRWYPSLTAADTTPVSTSYGQYGFPDNSAWLVPASTADVPFEMLTSVFDDGSGTLNIVSDAQASAAYATPEAASLATNLAGLAAVAGLLMAGARRRKTA